MLRALLGFIALVIATATNAQTLPRTPDGTPDLQGIWQARSRADEIVEEPAHCVPILRTSPTVLEMMTPDDDTAVPRGFAPD